jgi:hypothetical protein
MAVKLLCGKHCNYALGAVWETYSNDNISKLKHFIFIVVIICCEVFGYELRSEKLGWAIIGEF